MRRTHATLLVAALLAAACPSLAQAQSAGDNQYQDPFGNSAPPTSTTSHQSPSSQRGHAQLELRALPPPA